MASTPQQIIDALDDAILESAQAGFPVSYTINGRTYTAQSLDQITRLRSYYAQLLSDQQSGGARNRVEFGRD